VSGGLWTGLRDLALSARARAAEAATTETVRLGVTGLSRAGKTVFLVSLIGNLLALPRNLSAFPKLSSRLSGKLVSVEIEPSGLQRIPRFAYEANRRALAAGEAPSWPVATNLPAMIALRLVIRRKALGKRALRLVLLDYPGEWLLDLPLAGQDFAAWSGATLARLREPPRDRFAEEFLAFVGQLDPRAADDQRLALHGHGLYRAALRRAREEAGLRFLQPGRFLMPAPGGEPPVMQFFPWEVPNPRPGTLAALMRDRFRAYAEEVRRDFFEAHFRGFDRQVVLVDVLGALWAGKAAYADSREALSAVGEAYARLLARRGRRKTHVAFCATKADHVPSVLRGNLVPTLRAMVEGAGRLPDSGASFHALASVNCTSDGSVPAHGPSGARAEPVVMGVPLGESRQRPFSPGIVPAGEVPEGFWQEQYLALPVLRPPRFAAEEAEPVPQIGMDAMLEALIGDAL
jgi:predicted YcjX-like family ATPase